MTNIWRRQPTQRLSSYNLVKKEASSQSVAIANGFFEGQTLNYSTLVKAGSLVTGSRLLTWSRSIFVETGSRITASRVWGLFRKARNQQG